MFVIILQMKEKKSPKKIENSLIPIGIIVSVGLLCFGGYRLITYNSGSQPLESNPTQPNAPLSTPENVISGDPTSTSTSNGGGMPQNCTKILPGEYTWNAAQKIGDSSTIYDYRLYEIRNDDGSLIGTIIPGQWDIKTSTENQEKLRRMLPGTIVCGINPR
jgi:hypothetical protein